MPSKIDGVLQTVGACGKYQWTQLVILGCGSFIAAIHALSIVFHSITPNHRCKLPGWENDSYAIFDELHNETINQWIPVTKYGKLDSCTIYHTLNGTGNTTQSVICNEYVFDKSVYWGRTLNMEFGMLCAHAGAGTVVKLVFSCGLLAGPIIVGVIADRFGRKIVSTGCMIIGGITGVVVMFSVNYQMLAALHFIIGMSFAGVALLSHVMNMEIVGPSARTYSFAFRMLFWPSGIMFTSVFAYYVQDWRWFQLIISILPIVVGIFMIFFLKETPHFLVTRGRHNEAEALFKHMASMNGKTLPDDFMDQLKEAAVSEKLKDIFKAAPVFIKRTIIFCYLWFIAGMGFYGLNFNVGNLTGSIYVNNAISGAVETPQILFILLSKKTGRKGPFLFSVLFVGVALISKAFLSAYANVEGYIFSLVLVIVAMLGTIGMTVMFSFYYLWSSELFPTTKRSTLLGLCFLFASIGGLLSPIIMELNLHVTTVFGSGLGALLIGVTIFAGGILVFFLPETNNQKLPETIAQANVFMTSRQADDADEDGVEKLNMTSTADLLAQNTTL